MVHKWYSVSTWVKFQHYPGPYIAMKVHILKSCPFLAGILCDFQFLLQRFVARAKTSDLRSVFEGAQSLSDHTGNNDTGQPGAGQ